MTKKKRKTLAEYAKEAEAKMEHLIDVGGEGSRRIEYIPLSKLLTSGTRRNPKQHDIGAISQSVVRHGYVEPVVLDERTKRLVAGHGRVETLAALKKDKAKLPDGIREEKGAWLVPVMRGWASENDAQAEAYLLASNRTVELGGWDMAELQDVLRELGEAKGLDGSGFNGDDLDEMIKNTSAEITPEDIGTGAHKCPRCGFEFD